jgi:[acyl-carrier-protein] S-malonyltransferase
MKPAAERLATVLEGVTVADFSVPVVANADATPNVDRERVKPLLVTQVCAPVLWEQSVMVMKELGVETFIEIGPGKVLSGLVKRILKEAKTANVEDNAGLKALAG